MNFILLGAPRSGKHLMRRYIRSHPKLNCLTESDDVRFDNGGVTILTNNYKIEMNKYPLVILLRKNLVEQVLSHSLMNVGEEHQRHYVDGNQKELNEVTVNVGKFKGVYDTIKEQTKNILDKTKDTNRIIFWYEDIIPYNQTGWTAWMPNKESARLCKFLNVDWCRLSAKSKKIGQYNKILNLKELYEDCNITE